jgi:hypothetical protein
MNEMKLKITLSPKEVEQILKDHLKEKFSIVSDVKLETGQELRGQGYDEYYEAVFTGATCEVEM